MAHLFPRVRAPLRRATFFIKRALKVLFLLNVRAFEALSDRHTEDWHWGIEGERSPLEGKKKIWQNELIARISIKNKRQHARYFVVREEWERITNPQIWPARGSVLMPPRHCGRNRTTLQLIVAQHMPTSYVADCIDVTQCCASRWVETEWSLFNAYNTPPVRRPLNYIFCRLHK